MSALERLLRAATAARDAMRGAHPGGLPPSVTKFHADELSAALNVLAPVVDTAPRFYRSLWQDAAEQAAAKDGRR